MSLQVDVLGPVRVRRDTIEMPPGPTQRRAVLAVLVCHANRSVAVPRLVDAVWGDDPPRTATKNLQVHIYHLRQMLGDANRIAYGGNSYVLRAAPEEIDAVRFDRLVNAARDALDRDDARQAVGHANAALELWRGPAFCDLDRVGFVVHEARRLSDLRAAAQELRAQAWLRLGTRKSPSDGLRVEPLAMAPSPGTSTVDPDPVLSRDTLDWYVAAADAADRTLAVSRLERLPVADPHLRAPTELHQPVAARTWIDREAPRLATALRQALDRRWTAQAWKLAHAMFSAFRLRGEWSPWRSAYEEVVEVAAQYGDGVVGPLRVGLATAYAGSGAGELARAQLTLAREAARRDGDHRLHLAATCHLARRSLVDGQPAQAREWLSEADSLLETVEPDLASSLWRSALYGELHMIQGRYDEASEALDDALATAVAVADRHAGALMLCAQSRLRLRRGDRTGAAGWARQAVAVAVLSRDVPVEQKGRRQLDRCRTL
jgi:hypothetical protein